jgi:hypothetical protein
MVRVDENGSDGRGLAALFALQGGHLRTARARRIAIANARTSHEICGRKILVARLGDAIVVRLGAYYVAAPMVWSRALRTLW